MHTTDVMSVGYSPDGHHIISGSEDKTIRIWDAPTGVAVCQPLEGKGHPAESAASLHDAHHSVPGFGGDTVYMCDSIPHYLVQKSFSQNPLQADFCTKPDLNGWVRDSNNGLLYWVPPDCRPALHSPALLTIPMTSNVRSVSLEFEDFAFGLSWTQILCSP